MSNFGSFMVLNQVSSSNSVYSRESLESCHGEKAAS